ncbi:MAG: Tm-1-like ATP-binding domain-containing protein [Streptosporangiaceae bacterium]
MAAVALVGTLDTKGPDFAFLAARLRAAGAQVIVIDAGTGEPDGLTPDIDGDIVAAAAGTTRAELREAADRGRAVTEMGRGWCSATRRRPWPAWSRPTSRPRRPRRPPTTARWSRRACSA